MPTNKHFRIIIQIINFDQKLCFSYELFFIRSKRYLNKFFTQDSMEKVSWLGYACEFLEIIFCDESSNSNIFVWLTSLFWIALWVSAFQFPSWREKGHFVCLRERTWLMGAPFSFISKFTVRSCESAYIHVQYMHGVCYFLDMRKARTL